MSKKNTKSIQLSASLAVITFFSSSIWAQIEQAESITTQAESKDIKMSNSQSLRKQANASVKLHSAELKKQTVNQSNINTQTKNNTTSE
ncbi:MAG: hypothetical protein Q8R83_04000 [Legionellaceae bacterium]|nr:hypothetical protein [Legionellaceae bacterium]